MALRREETVGVVTKMPMYDKSKKDRRPGWGPQSKTQQQPADLVDNAQSYVRLRQPGYFSFPEACAPTIPQVKSTLEKGHRL